MNTFRTTLLLLSLLTVGAGCVSSPKPAAVVPTPTPSAAAPAQPAAPAAGATSTFDPRTVKAGDVVAGLTVVSAGPFFDDDRAATDANYKIIFDGTPTVSGTYDYSFSDFDGAYVLHFAPSSAALASFPHIPTDTSVFRLNDDAAAAKLLGIEKNTPAKGEATVVLAQIEFAGAPAEVENSATLVRTVTATPAASIVLAASKDKSFVVRGEGACGGSYMIDGPKPLQGARGQYDLVHPITPEDSDLGSVIVQTDAQFAAAPAGGHQVAFRAAGTVVEYVLTNIASADCVVSVARE